MGGESQPEVKIGTPNNLTELQKGALKALKDLNPVQIKDENDKTSYESGG